MNFMPSALPTRWRFPGLIIVMIVVILLARFAWAGRTQAAPIGQQDSAVPVLMQQVQQQDLPIWLEAIGNVQPLNSVNVRVRVDGELQKVLFAEGQMEIGRAHV